MWQWSFEGLCVLPERKARTLSCEIKQIRNWTLQLANWRWGPNGSLVTLVLEATTLHPDVLKQSEQGFEGISRHIREYAGFYGLNGIRIEKKWATCFDPEITNRPESQTDRNARSFHLCYFFHEPLFTTSAPHYCLRNINHYWVYMTCVSWNLPCAKLKHEYWTEDK